jgi:integrase
VRGRHQEASQDEYVFPTSSGARLVPNNFRARVLKVAVKRTNENLEARGLPPLPERLTPHSLRRTFCSLLYALGETPPVVMRQMGHTDPQLAIKVYEQSMEDDEGDKAALTALVEGGELTADAEDVASDRVER